MFLCHAQIYVFADEKGITALKQLALETLHETLKHFELYQERTGDIVTLLKYIYKNTTLPPEDKSEPMRAMLNDYVAFEMDTLTGDQKLTTALSEDGSDMLGDFMANVRKRI